MRIAIIADTHDNVNNTEKLVKILNRKVKPDLVIHLGDLVSPFMIPILSKIKAPVEIVFGNNDGDLDGIVSKSADYKNINIQGAFGYGSLEAQGRKIFFNHFPDLAADKAEEGRFDLVLYGHNHRKKIERISPPTDSTSSLQARLGVKKTLLVNPGEIGGIFYKPTFAVYDTAKNKIEFINLK